MDENEKRNEWMKMRKEIVSKKRSLASSSLAEWLNKQNNKSMEFLLG
jgi:hypothetical protein